MSQTDEELVDEALLAFNAITLQMGKRSFNQQKRTCEAWLAQYVPQLEARGCTEDALLLRRVVAAWLINVAVEVRRPARAFEPLLRDIEALGWLDLQHKELKIGVMCGYFADRMWKKEGFRYLLPLKREVEQEYARTGGKTWAMALDGIAGLERRLRSRKRPF
ncbi:MAG TPA: hypothetical protein VH877_05630 [Polyangia bacterium]|jgi:hypothetical protein|nr:hypothetical protein [Polyangia bacterium]